MQALHEAMGMPRLANEQDEYDRTVATARAILSAKVFEAAWAAGRAMSIEQAIAYAIEDTQGQITTT